MAEENEDAKCLLNNALSDGIIDQSQYDELLLRSTAKTEVKEKKDIQRTLIISGIAIIVFVIGFGLLLVFRDFTYIAKIAIMIILTLTLFIGSWITKETRHYNLHHGLLSGASNMFVFGYGYWFYNEVREVGWSSREFIGPADRDPLLAIPLLVIPILILYYQINKNSRGGSQLGILSLIFGSMILIARLDEYFMNEEIFYYLLGAIGLIILACIIYLNIMWRLGKHLNSLEYYKKRYRTIDSLLSTGYFLGSIYLIFFFGMLSSESSDGSSNAIAVGAFITLVLGFIMIIYGIKSSKKGIFLTACGIVILSTWIFGLTIMGGIAFLIMSVLSGFMLIGIAMFMKTVPGFNNKKY